MFFKLVCVLYFGFLFNLHADEGKRCLLDLCDGDMMDNLWKKGYDRRHGAFIASKKISYKGHNAELLAYFKKPNAPFCDKSIKIHFDKWDNKDVEKIIKSINPAISIGKDFPVKESSLKERLLDVSYGKSKKIVKYYKGADGIQIRISLGPTCTMIERRDYHNSSKNITPDTDDGSQYLPR